MTSRVGRKRITSEYMTARFPEGTGDRIKAVLSPKESKMAFIRDAVAREIARRKAHPLPIKRKD